MSQHHHHHHQLQQQPPQSQISGNNNSSSGSNSSSSSIPISEVYWSLVDKADKKFSKIRDLPSYERHRYDTYFYKVFKVYTQLWKFQQENRQKLVEAGLKRWEIGEIASRIAQLYFGQYMRTSEISFLSEAYVFYEAILTREYFREGSYQDINLANKQLRFLARFLMVCLIFNKREMVNQLVNQLKLLLDEYKRTFQESDFKEWKLVVQEVTRFLKADTAFMNTRPLRYSLVLDTHPDSFPQSVASVSKRTLRLREAILSSYHHYEVKFSELTLDTFRMLQSLEWEPSGSFYQPAATKVGASGRSQTNFSQDIVDHTLPANPRKAVLYRPSVTHFVAVLATICEELPPDGVLLIYLSASGRGVLADMSQSGLGTFLNPKENMVKNVKQLAISSDASSSTQCDQKSETTTPSAGENKDDSASNTNPCLQFGNHGNGGLNCIYPHDLLPFTRKPLFLIIDSESSTAFQAICGAEKGEPAALLLSPRSSPTAASDFSRPCGSLFTIFLTSPLQAFCIMLGFSNSEVDMDAFTKAEKLLASSLDDFGLILATSDVLNPVWAQVLNDPFLRRLLLRFIFCQAVLGLYNSTFGKEEFMPKCMPYLPESVTPTNVVIQSMVLQIANVFGVTSRFNCREELMNSESRNREIGSMSSS